LTIAGSPAGEMGVPLRRPGTRQAGDLQGILARLEAKGYDTAILAPTKHPQP
jgi:hypothetical protein